jgi:hypothetical protein
MDKLAPVLKQKFWILLGIGVIMTITGWWMATGTLAATTKTRRDAVEAAFKRIPAGEIPNNDWSSKLSARNSEQDRAVKATAAMLWERQKSRMTWPESVVNFAWTKGYRGEILLPGRENYRLSYGYDVRRVWESVRPFKMIDGSGVVLYGADEKVLPQVKWGQLAPSSNDMWDAQEDLWLLESILQAIVAVNGREGGRADASIHVIEKLLLCGGQPPAQRKAGGGTTATGMGGGGAMPGAGHGMSGPPNSFGGTGGDLGGGMGARAGGAALGDANFDPKDELGDDGSAKAGGMTGGGMMSAGPGSAHGAAGPPGGMNAGGPGAAASVRRYVEDDAALPYKSRGFYMTVIMDHRKIPSLIAELTANEYSAWPVEILRVQMVRLHDDDVGSGTGAAGSMAGGMGGGAGGTGFNISTLLTAGGPGGNMASGFPGAPGATSEGFTPPNTTTSGVPGAVGQGATNNPAAGGIAALQSSLQDPYMARVAICGVITLYKEVKPEPVVAAPATPTPPAAVAPVAPTAPANPDPAATPEAAPPAAEGTPESKPADAPTTPEAPATPNPTPDQATPPAKPPADPAAPPEPAKPPEKT